MHLYCYNINLCIHVYIQDGQSANDQFSSDDIIGMSSGAIQYFLDKLRSKVYNNVWLYMYLHCMWLYMYLHCMWLYMYLHCMWLYILRVNLTLC